MSIPRSFLLTQYQEIDMSTKAGQIHSLTVSPLPSGLVKVKTGTNTTDAVYDAWYDKVYEPSSTAASSSTGSSSTSGTGE
jgi:hypothetical protein